MALRQDEQHDENDKQGTTDPRTALIGFEGGAPSLVVAMTASQLRNLGVAHIVFGVVKLANCLFQGKVAGKDSKLANTRFFQEKRRCHSGQQRGQDDGGEINTS